MIINGRKSRDEFEIHQINCYSQMRNVRVIRKKESKAR